MARLVVGVNDLATTHPDLAAELVDQTLATQLSAGSQRKVEWCCAAEGHIWSAIVGNRTSKGSGCPYCSGHLAIIGETDLATLRPDLAAELVDQSLATKLTVRSSKKVDWRCTAKGHIWTTSVTSRSLGSGCLVCSNWQARPHYNDLATTHPELAAELVDQSLATQLTARSGKKPKWCCNAHGHVWSAAVGDRSGRGYGCPYCSNKRVLAGFNDLATTHTDLAAELLDQSVGKIISAGSHRKVEWRCRPHGHIWTASVANRATHGSGCPYCTGFTVLPGFNDLATLRPDLAAQLADQSLSSTVTVSSGKKLDWACPAHGHIWTAAVITRSQIGSGCPYCAGFYVLAGFNDLATLRPDLAAQLVDPTLATKLTLGNDRLVRWKCPAHGHIWKTSATKRAGRGDGCPECATSGFSQVGIGWLYLLATPGRRVFKFGITNDLDGRLDKHSRQGFTELVEERLYEYGGDAVAIETALRRHKKAMGWQNGMTKANMPDGYTETLLADDCGEDFTLSGFIASLPADSD